MMFEGRFAAGVVVSNAGPVATAELVGEAVLPAGYLRRLRESNAPGTLITLNFATRAPIRGLDGLVFFVSIPVMEAVEYLQGIHVLPVLLHLP